jgi:dTDP-4-dehydrorhamnose reductase
MRIAVAGAQGQLGAAIVHDFASRHDVVSLAHEDLDISDDAAVKTSMERLRPDAIVNCAAYNDVDGAEDDPVRALNVNAFAVRALAASAAAAGSVFVHFSSDFVFDGTASAPYTEADRPNPRSVYAASKLVGEWFAADAGRWYVLRVESLFGHVRGGRLPKGSVAGVLKKLMTGEQIMAFEDRTVTPTYVVDAARATRQLIETAAPAGVYHCVNSGAACTWLELARELARQLGVEPRLIPVRQADLSLRAERPNYCALSNVKLLSAGVVMPTRQDAFARYLSVIRDDVGHQVSDG